MSADRQARAPARLLGRRGPGLPDAEGSVPASLAPDHRNGCQFLEMVGPDWPVPDFSTLSRRQDPACRDPLSAQFRAVAPADRQHWHRGGWRREWCRREHGLFKTPPVAKGPFGCRPRILGNRRYRSDGKPSGRCAHATRTAGPDTTSSSHRERQR